MFDLAALDAALAETIFARKLHFSPVTGSTNTDALAAARNAAPHGLVYFADEQQAGRGRGDALQGRCLDAHRPLALEGRLERFVVGIHAETQAAVASGRGTGRRRCDSHSRWAHY